MNTRKSGDMLRPHVRYYNSTKEYVVFSRQPMFGNRGKAVELFRSTDRAEAYNRLKEVLENDAKLTSKQMLQFTTNIEPETTSRNNKSANRKARKQAGRDANTITIPNQENK